MTVLPLLNSLTTSSGGSYTSESPFAGFRRVASPAMKKLSKRVQRQQGGIDSHGDKLHSIAESDIQHLDRWTYKETKASEQRKQMEITGFMPL